MLLQIQDGTLSVGAQTVLAHFDFEIRGNEKIAIVGRNGCGKTTLAKKLKETILRRKYWKGTDEEFLKVEKDILEETIREISDINNWERIVLSTIKDEQIVEDWLKERF